MAKKSQSRMENILENKLDGTQIEEPAQSRIEVLLNRLIATMSVGTQTGGGTVDLSGIQNDLYALRDTLADQDTKMITLQDTVNTNHANTEQTITKINQIIESIENNIEAIDEEIHEPEILNAPIIIEGQFPSVLGGTFNEANLDEMYLWTYFVPKDGVHQIPFEKQAGMEHLNNLMTKIFNNHKSFVEMNEKIKDLESKYNTLYQKCTDAGLFN